ncbi:16S rRNA (cytosine(1402)-N(4))-methyltransferase RsmH [Flavobacteriaceae bacterium]|nr:16S rRNA (cytosine(1402)-N(4))-methyltransferase RsmH [Flavobacteriaceae bacterium]MDA9041622.1 16S rRNA (cytosine(1402)-N(4))-methyltransferase RsmH [Flavobacteriaceae bacterium]MDA9276683.1 16S rRNA (cytosine(1402)-N(4))-methyltransferase RsmH [Flavobacteriaceae bacterium]MDC0559514.1 16S rRNA (cytosine(1402)-N(4))-methyltransferase RsmH [Flavobacteriaceae bacterium]MDC0923249.1 16S rRNA (cytosine(1402)-N(4))-methyltransferase RsmH [Flavobacteriaceae bacterium]|tara:strand:+ start:1008 stop:1910 length:903 start_codon:yes stop_codon:yes gene_type:complete
MIKMYHNPVLLKESIIGLNINPNGIYVDATFGGGGHSTEILNKLNSSGRLIAFDQDQDAIDNKILDNRVSLVKSNFKYLNNYLNYFEINKIDGLLADFGISSYQIDNEKRGFSTRFDSELDMRMNNSQKTDAKAVVNDYKKDQLEYIFKNFGELKNYKRITEKIISERAIKYIDTTNDLKIILKSLTIPKEENKFFAKVFQAIRIEVNDELEVIKTLLDKSLKYLKKGGRLVCISYHSLEDRLVKKFIQNGGFRNETSSDLYGNKELKLKKIGKMITPSEKEIIKNNRSRSAKLRIAEKI